MIRERGLKWWRKKKSQLRTKEENETIEQKSQLSIKEGSESIEPVNEVFTFYKFLEFLEMLYNIIWVRLGLLLKCFQKFRNYWSVFKI